MVDDEVYDVEGLRSWAKGCAAGRWRILDSFDDGHRRRCSPGPRSLRSSGSGSRDRRTRRSACSPRAPTCATQAAFFHMTVYPAADHHDHVISLFVLGLLAWIVHGAEVQRQAPIPYGRPVQRTTPPSKSSGRSCRCVILVRSSRHLLLPACFMPTTTRRRPDVTIKATGNQWYWAYEYPDAKIAEYTFDSNPLNHVKAEAQGHGSLWPRRRQPHRGAGEQDRDQGAGDRRRRTARLLCARPSGCRPPTIPGKVNEVWFKAAHGRQILWRVQRAVRCEPLLHADRGRCGQPSRTTTPGSPRKATKPPVTVPAAPPAISRFDGALNDR